MLRVDIIRPNGDIYIVGDVPLEVLGKCHQVLNEDAEIFVSNTNIEGLFKYGIKQLVADYYHEVGYTWNSRASVMNKLFGCAMIDVYYKVEGTLSYQICAIDLVHLEPLLEGTGYVIDWVPYESDAVDISYRIIKENNHESY